MHRLKNGLVAAVVGLGAAMVAGSCGGDGDGNLTDPRTPRDLNGNWALASTYNSSQLQVTCTLTGTVAIAQSGTNFSGQLSGSSRTCSGPAGTTTANVDAPLTGGQLTGNGVTYSDALCSYTGTISGSPANRVEGDLECEVPILGTTYPFEGTWQLTR